MKSSITLPVTLIATTIASKPSAINNLIFRDFGTRSGRPALLWLVVEFVTASYPNRHSWGRS